MYLFDDSREPRTIGVNSPGGVARQYRVQYRYPLDDDRLWHQSASCVSREQAEACADELEQRGFETRVVPFQLCPAA